MLLTYPQGVVMSEQAKFPEHYLYKIWSNGVLNGKTLTTQDGQPLTILKTGERNTIGGPDFQNTVIILNEKRVSGEIEFHVSVDEWYSHQHHIDKHYNQVILHVSFFDSNQDIITENKQTIPQLILSHYLTIQQILDHLVLSERLDFKTEIPCAHHLNRVRDNIKYSVLRQYGHLHFLTKVNRFGERCELLLKSPTYVLGKRYVWDQLFFEGLFRVLGYPNNKEAFERLAKDIPVVDWSETDSLSVWYDRLLDKSGITDSNNTVWKKGGVFSVNQPEKRMKVGAFLIKKYDKSGFLKPILTTVDAYLNMQKPSKKIVRELIEMLSPDSSDDISFGTQKREAVVFNSWFPILYLYGNLFERHDIQQLILSVCDDYDNRQKIASADRMLSYMNSEKKSLTLIWGALEIQERMCKNKNCMDCGIGQEILRS